MKIIFLGPPGSGKGTQAKRLSKDLNITHISTGDIFRYNLKNNTDLGKKAQAYMNKGLLVPDNITNEMLKERIEKPDCSNGYILDGYPRTISQAEFLETIQDIDMVVNFDLSTGEILKRISGRRTCESCGAMYHVEFNPPKKDSICDQCGGRVVQRKDDKPEAVLKRIEEYKQKTMPLIEHYKKKGILKNINAALSIDEVSRSIRELLSS